MEETETRRGLTDGWKDKGNERERMIAGVYSTISVNVSALKGSARFYQTSCNCPSETQPEHGRTKPDYHTYMEEKYWTPGCDMPL